jgi:hypothetical protein
VSLALLLALNAAAAPADPPALLELDFDLARLSPPQLGLPGRCNRADPSAIVVCARRGGGQYPLEEMAHIFAPRRLIAETRLIGNLVGDVHVESGGLDRGAASNRIMVGVRLPF